MECRYHIVCVSPFHNYQKGQMIIDQVEVAKLLSDREHHFVRVAVPNPNTLLEEPPEEKEAESK